MEFNNFLTNLSLIQKLAPIEIPIFVHHSQDEKKHFFDFQTVRENTGNEYWSVLIVEMEGGWAVFDNIGPSDSMSVSCAISSNISLPKPADLKHILNHYFPGRSNLHVFDVIEFSKHDPLGMISAMLFTYCRIFRQPWPKRTILEQESNVTALKLYFRSCELSKKLAKFPSWVLRGPLDDDYIIPPTSHEGLMSDEELYHRGLLKQAMRQNRATSRDGKRKFTSSSRLSRTAVVDRSTENREELTPAELDKLREELDEYILPNSDEEVSRDTESGSDIMASILADMPSTLDGVSVSPHFKGMYSVLFEVDIEDKVKSMHSRGNLRNPLLHELSAVNKTVRSGKQVQYREKCKEKKERLREKEDSANMERERVDKRRRLVKGDVHDSGDDDLPIIDGIFSDDIALKKKTIRDNKKSQEQSGEIEFTAVHPLNPRHDLVNQTVPVTSSAVITSPPFPNLDILQAQDIHRIDSQSKKCSRDLAKPHIFQQILDGDLKLSIEYRRHMAHYKSCNNQMYRTDRIHYNCLICKNYVSSIFKRVVNHSLTCDSLVKTLFLVKCLIHSY